MPLLLFNVSTRVQCCAKGQHTPWQIIHISHCTLLTVHLQENQSIWKMSPQAFAHFILSISQNSASWIKCFKTPQWQFTYISSDTLSISQNSASWNAFIRSLLTPSGDWYTSHLILSLLTKTILKQNAQSVRIVQAGMLCQIFTNTQWFKLIFISNSLLCK